MDHDENGENHPHIKVHRRSTIYQFVGWSQASSIHPYLILRVYNLGLEVSRQELISILVHLTSSHTDPLLLSQFTFFHLQTHYRLLSIYSLWNFHLGMHFQYHTPRNQYHQ